MAKTRVHGLQCQLKTSEKEWAHLAKFEVLGIVDFWQFCKKVTSTMHNFLNFEPLEVFLDFLEILICPLTNSVGLISILCSMIKYEYLTKKVFLLDFKNDL